MCASHAIEASSISGTKPTSPVSRLMANHTARKVTTGLEVSADLTGSSGPPNTPRPDERSILKPFSLFELSVQARLICVLETVVAVRFDGALGGPGVTPVAVFE